MFIYSNIHSCFPCIIILIQMTKLMSSFKNIITINLRKEKKTRGTDHEMKNKMIFYFSIYINKHLVSINNK